MRIHYKGRYNLFRKYFIIVSMIIFLSFAILGGALMLFVANSWVDEREVMLRENAQSIADTTAELLESDYMRDNERGSVLLICSTLSILSDAVDADFFISDLDGHVLYCRELLRPDMVVISGSCIIHGKYDISSEVLTEAVASGFYSTIGNLDGIYTSPHLVVAVPITVKDQAIAVVCATQPIVSAITPYVVSILRMFGLASLLSLALSVVMLYYMIYRFTKPLRQMSAATKSYAAGDFSYRVDIKGHDELAELAEGFNAMAKDLATLESSRRSFVANVSHELKTPMTTIGGFIDGILDGTIEKDKTEHYLHIVSDEVRRLSRLVTSMLNMSKIEAGELSLKPKRFDISELLFKTFLAFEQLIEKKAIDVRGLEQLQMLQISADEDMINQVIYNLVDNAVKFTPPGGVIEAAAYSDAENAVVRIRNSGDGISSEEIGKIFERFYKVDKSRSFDTRGAGLGLYIVKSIVELHGGKVSVRSTQGQYTEFAFTLPLKLPQ